MSALEALAAAEKRLLVALETIESLRSQLAEKDARIERLEKALREINEFANIGYCDCECDDALTGEERHALSCPITMSEVARAALEE